MELWIRSQDKTTLIRSYEIYISEYGKGSYVIRAKKTSHILGVYKTMERALEVLDEIQNFICIEIHLNNINYENADLILKGKIVDSLYKIYQMPED